MTPSLEKLSKKSIGLLLCDDVPEDGRERFGNYLGMFQRGISAVDSSMTLTAYAAYEGVLPDQPQDHDGYIITGSAASVFEDLPWIPPLMEFIRSCYRARVKMAGICFGHQLIAHSLGGKTERSDNGWGFGIHRADITANPDWLETENEDFHLVVIHQDQVVDLPEGFFTLASNDFCPYSMISDNDLMLGIQGHPEFSKEYCAYRAQARRELIGESKYQETLELLEGNESESAEVLGWVSQFLRKD
ncbi:MAG: hypothetical protein KTR18_12015 [Acidiferrobacterales bacterium]|nr:hypothetical protein [Acidiferrobacterales bacterium]